MAVVDGVNQDSISDGDEKREPIEVLVVDDDPAVASLAQTFLERVDDGVAVTTATDAPAGLEKLREREFDAVVSDYHMPAMDGLTFLNRSNDVAPATPGLIFSSDDDPEVVEAVHEANVPYAHKQMRAECFQRLASDLRAAVRNRRD